MAQMTAAGELMVMEVVTSASGIWSNSTSMSASELIATPHLPTSPSDKRVVGVISHERGQIERDGKAGLALREQIAEALRWYLRAVPNPANCRMVHSRSRYIVGVNAARVRRLAGKAEVALRVPTREIGLGVQAANRVAGNGGEIGVTSGVFRSVGARVFSSHSRSAADGLRTDSKLWVGSVFTALVIGAPPKRCGFGRSQIAKCTFQPF